MTYGMTAVTPSLVLHATTLKAAMMDLGDLGDCECGCRDEMVRAIDSVSTDLDALLQKMRKADAGDELAAIELESAEDDALSQLIALSRCMRRLHALARDSEDVREFLRSTFDADYYEALFGCYDGDDDDD